MTGSTVLIIDFGSQYTQLIARKVRELSVFSVIYPHTITVEQIKEIAPKGIILSGGPMSVKDDGAPAAADGLFSTDIPILGICYGLQLISYSLGGIVEPAQQREYGKTSFRITERENPLFAGIPEEITVWMSHGDVVKTLPYGFRALGSSPSTLNCAAQSDEKPIYGLQFHPEVYHSEYGVEMISNFLFRICGCVAGWNPGAFIEGSIRSIKEQAGDSVAICALSGGVDSTVAAVLVREALGDNLVCVHIDNGLMRKNESETVVKRLREKTGLKITAVDASETFLKELEGVTDPEEKRKIIGSSFIKVFEEEARKIEGVSFLVQGTLYPDVIESVPVNGVSVTIKTHHNVGGLPEKMNFKLIEPFRELFKDEVREIGLALGIPPEIVNRHPFPGPGLAVRVLGEVTAERLELLREADDIFITLVKKHNLYDKVWQAFTVLLPVQTVGVMGDKRTYENVLALRAVTSVDGMTADWFRFPDNFLAEVSNTIINNLEGINRVVYDISSKPPATIEWE
ncbi:MAG: glutamine-hydrolyzing GMP synthase [Ignavibacteriales bacterium]|jgi:GMP synthase (glutamine-hydrolyzing) (EC 6.3.5.2)|nr:MAG: glutamine-hydrolyzing GMP synthase [Ignavibacteriaceae bacterium]MBW7873282.1 glutamine-hydrolyzing GMP synthase [Ignavibacteria bacterium]MCZ2143020.1 glutamine-hydrolyzing GMP synthase [Ignavibacteriales bacterium]OQY77475.1 MAG: GMP synthase (glutamine-hydrolyzing) [Ignavibacteriales bacterium UTCHB3]MBV6444710.1 GMP synthase [glutamine-hydrolyzing] [Ignavibacteriaceae bacterium]